MPSPLSLDEDAMRRLGYQAVDALVSHYQTVAAKPVAPAERDQFSLPRRLRRFPRRRQPADEVLSAALESVFTNIMQLTHPRFYAYIPGPSNYIGALADFIAAGFNVFAGTAPRNLGAYEVERRTVRWLCDLAGLDERAGGVFVSGGSVASLTALTAARHIQLRDRSADAVAYYSAETHSSVERALFILGFAKRQCRVIPVDQRFRIDLAALRAAVAEDKRRGLRPFCVVGNAGTTNTGAVDPLRQLAAVCRQEKMWFHVDAAYGGGGLLSASERRQFAGIEAAHSIALDPHKWLFQPYECGCVLARDPAWLRAAFRRLPDYMRDSDEAGVDNFRDLSPQVTRAFKAFKLWLSLQVFGTDAFRQAVERGIEMAKFSESCLAARECWEIVSPATLGVVAFRYVIAGRGEERLDELNAAIIERINDDGFAYFSSTVLNGRKVNRICPLHPALTRDDITRTIARLEAIAEDLLKEAKR